MQIDDSDTRSKDLTTTDTVLVDDDGQLQIRCFIASAIRGWWLVKIYDLI